MHPVQPFSLPAVFQDLDRHTGMPAILCLAGDEKIEHPVHHLRRDRARAVAVEINGKIGSISTASKAPIKCKDKLKKTQHKPILSAKAYLSQSVSTRAEAGKIFLLLATDLSYYTLPRGSDLVEVAFLESAC